MSYIDPDQAFRPTRPQPSFFFYDLETSGLSPREDRIMQFAGQRTTLDLKPLGDPINLLVKLADDTLPSPGAIMVTKITPQSTQQDGLTEKELCDYLATEIFTPETCVIGYNSIRFDDEFIRHLFWRNFYDPYEWQWQDGRSRWDLLDVVRLTRALRPEGIKWPFQPKKIKDPATGADQTIQVPTNRLELITKLNGITHAHAHDALSDVEALIDVTRLIKERQPQLYDYLFKMRAKRAVQKLINLDDKKPFVYACGSYSSDHQKTTVAFPLAPGRNGNLLVFDLRYNLDELLADTTREAQERSFYPIVKELAYNKCPAVAPLGVLEQADGWQKLGLTSDQIQANLKSLLAHPEFAEQMRTRIENKPEWPPAIDPESALYDGFLPEPDRMRCAKVRSADADTLADLGPGFTDERLPDLLLHYKAKNFPSSLSEADNLKWEEYRSQRLARQAPKFLAELKVLSGRSTLPASAVTTAEQRSDPVTTGVASVRQSTPSEKDFIREELELWYQSLLPGDY